MSNKKYKISLGDIEDIYFISINAQQSEDFYSALTTYQDNPLYIEKIFNIVTESRYTVEDFPAGIPLIIIYLSLKISGYLKSTEDFPTIIDSNRSRIKYNTFFIIYSHISKVFPSYKLEELKRMSTNEVFELLAYAEKVAGGEFFDTEKMKKAIEEEKLPPSQTVKKGISGVTKDELDLLNDIINQEEFQYQGLPHY